MFKKAVAVLLCMGMLAPTAVLAEDGSKLLVNESFNSYATYEVPDITLSGKGIGVMEYGTMDKALKFVLNSGEKKAEFEVATEQNFFVSFDVQSNAAFGGAVRMKNGTTGFELLNFENGDIKTHNNSKIGMVGTGKRNVVISVNLTRRKYNVYMDGKILADEYFASGMTMRRITGIEFGFSSEKNAELFLDNVNIASGEYSVGMTFPVDEYSDEITEDTAFTKNVTSDTYLNGDFSSSSRMTATYNNKDNILENAVDSDGNGYCRFERIGSQDLHLDISVGDYSSDSLVYEFDIYNENKASRMEVQFKDSNNNYQTLCKLSEDGVISVGNYKATIPLKEWHTVSVVYDRFNQELRGYLDNVMFADKVAAERLYDPTKVVVWRFHVKGSGSSEKFRLDNLRVYGGEAPSEPTVTESSGLMVEISEDTYVWNKDTAERSFMQDKVGYHLRSGILYANGEKTAVAAKNINDRLLVPASLLKTAFGMEVQYDSTGTITLPNGTMQIGNPDAHFKGKAVTLNGQPEEVDGDVYIPLRSVCEDLLGKSVYYDNTAISGGMLIISDKPVDEEIAKMDLQELNNFLFYERPSAKRILEDYNNSDLKGVHPRLLATQDDFDRIKGLVTTDENMKEWYGQLIKRADEYLTQPAAIYEIRDGVRLWYVCNEVVESVTALALAYKLTGDERYAERAWADLESVTDFPNWNPSHHIDVASMAIAYSIGYDWLYDWLTPERREIMEQGIYKQAFYDYNLAYQTTSSLMAGGVKMENNHNAVMNGGAVMMSMAFMDVYPELASYFISSAIRCTEYTAWHFAPEGSWYEGTSYGIMTLRFYAYEIAPLEMILGQNYSLKAVEGMSNAARVIVTMQYPGGAYKFADHPGSTAIEYDPGVTWFAQYYGDTATPTCWYSSFKYIYGEDDKLARTMLWYRPEYSDAGGKFATDYFYPVTDVITMRDDWGEDAEGLVGLKGGMPNIDHGHMDIGSFGFYTNNTEWATDMGYEDYNLPRYWNGATIDDTRWTYFRLRGEAHNCLVIDPDYNAEFDPNVNAEIVRFESKEKGAIAVVDMTGSYGDEKVKSARRGFFYTDERHSLVVRDEVELKKKSELDWFMITRQNVEIDGNSVILTDTADENNKLRIDFAASADFTLSAGTPVPLETSPNPSGLKDNKGYTRIRLVMNTGSNATITAKLTPVGWSMASPVGDYDKSIDEWVIPDGERIREVELGEIIIGGGPVKVTASEITYYSRDAVVPEVTAYSELYNIEVQKAADFAELTRVIASDKQYPENKKVYNVRFKQLKDAGNTGYAGVTELPIAAVWASAEPQPVNNAANVLDRDLSTRWSADYVESVTADLGSVQSFDKVIMSFYNGASRNYRLSIEVSENNTDYQTVFDGASKGGTDGYEAFDIGECSARYIRITGKNGSNANEWNSWTELAVAKTN